MGQASKRKRVPPMLTSSPGRSADSVTFTPFTKLRWKTLIDDPEAVGVLEDARVAARTVPVQRDAVHRVTANHRLAA